MTPLLLLLLAAQDADRLRGHLEVLAGDAFEGRNAGYPGGAKAAEYLREHLRKIGCGPLEAGYDQPFEFETRPKSGERLSTRNVIGFVPGTDEALKREVIVLGAHYDHVGRAGQADFGRMKSAKAPDDVIWNGADDNGSGTVAVMEVARAFLEGKVRTKRSVLFVWFSAEEAGLYGSAHFVRNVPKPLRREDIAAMVNVDMAGRNPSRPLEVGCLGTSDAWSGIVDRCVEGLDLKVKKSASVTSGSDHANFARAKIPTLSCFSGFHEDYHRPTDHADRIAYANLEKIARFALRLVTELGNIEQRPPWRDPPGEVTRAEGRRLGIRGADADKGGIEIEEVIAGSAAEKGGLKAGDLLVEFNGSALPKSGALEALRPLVQAAKPDLDISVVVLRGGARVTLSVRW